MRIGLFFLLSLVLFISNCAQDAIDQEMVDKEIIEQYLADNSLTATLHEDGIYYSRNGWWYRNWCSTYYCEDGQGIRNLNRRNRDHAFYV